MGNALSHSTKQYEILLELQKHLSIIANSIHQLRSISFEGVNLNLNDIKTGIEFIKNCPKIIQGEDARQELKAAPPSAELANPAPSI